jgi:nitrate reductase molybdenum cofactor assembly chaperone NarJ/NarW
MAERLHPLKLASVLLGYPDEARREAAAALPEFELRPVRGRDEAALRELAAFYAATPLAELERLYVNTFDFTKSCGLHLTYHVYGDQRKRGVAMLEIKERMRAAGFEPPGAELPDYLPLLLEFAALTDGGRGGPGLELLEDNRVAIELIRAGLARERSPFTPLLEAVVAALPRLGSRKIARIRRLAAEGPPVEEVGLEPFAPPEVMPR